MKDENPAFEIYKKSFPSDRLLENLYGSKEELLRLTRRQWNRHLFFKGPIPLFNDVSLSKALNSGLLRRSRNPLRWLQSFPFVVDKQKFREEYDVFAKIRHEFDSIFRLQAVHGIRSNERNRQIKLPLPRFVFQNGRCDESLRERLGKVNPDDEAELCREFIQHFKAGAFHEDQWWRWVSEGDSIWIEVIPEALYSFRVEREEKHRKAKEGFKKAVSTAIFK